MAAPSGGIALTADLARGLVRALNAEAQWLPDHVLAQRLATVSDRRILDAVDRWLAARWPAGDDAA